MFSSCKKDNLIENIESNNFRQEKASLAKRRYNNDFSFIMGDDLQSFRSNNNLDNTFLAARWREFQTKVVSSMNYSDKKFIISSSDISEYGNPKPWNAFHGIYDKANADIFIGLGNREYKDNKGNCHSVLYPFSSDACAYYSVNQVKKIYQNIRINMILV